MKITLLEHEIISSVDPFIIKGKYGKLTEVIADPDTQPKEVAKSFKWNKALIFNGDTWLINADSSGKLSV